MISRGRLRSATGHFGELDCAQGRTNLMPEHAILFDLDGTLLDTLADIAASANEALLQFGFARHPVGAYRQFVGAGVRRLFAQALPPAAATTDQIARCAEAFRAAYGRRWNAETRPYAGIPELLDALTRRGMPLSVLSNKPHAFTLQCVGHYFPATEFRMVLGEGPETPPKPDPAGANRIIAAMGLPASRVLYVGDTPIDMQAARAAGARPVGALWGFRSRDEIVAGGAQTLIAHPRELLDLLECE